MSLPVPGIFIAYHEAWCPARRYVHRKGFVDLAQYFVFTGSKINALNLSIPNNGLVTGSLDVIAKQMSAPSGTSLGTPINARHARALYRMGAGVQGRRKRRNLSEHEPVDHQQPRCR